MAARLEHRVALLLRAQQTFFSVAVRGFEFRLLGLVLAFVIIGDDVANVLVVHCGRLDVFGVLFVIAFDEYFTQIRITGINKICEMLAGKIFNRTYGHKSKGVCSFRFLTVKSAPLAARKQAIDAEAFLSVF